MLDDQVAGRASGALGAHGRGGHGAAHRVRQRGEPPPGAGADRRARSRCAPPWARRGSGSSASSSPRASSSSVGGAAGHRPGRCWGLSALVRLAPPEIPRLDEVALDGRVLVFALAGGAGGHRGLRPPRPPPARAAPPARPWVASRRTEGGGGPGLSRSLLLSGEVALSLTLLLGAGLLFGTLRHPRSRTWASRSERVERFRVSTPESRYDVDATIRFFDELERRLEASPRCRRPARRSGCPVQQRAHLHVAWRSPTGRRWTARTGPRLRCAWPRPGYLEATGVPLLEGAGSRPRISGALRAWR